MPILDEVGVRRHMPNGAMNQNSYSTQSGSFNQRHLPESHDFPSFSNPMELAKLSSAHDHDVNSQTDRRSGPPGLEGQFTMGASSEMLNESRQYFGKGDTGRLPYEEVYDFHRGLQTLPLNSINYNNTCNAALQTSSYRCWSNIETEELFPKRGRAYAICATSARRNARFVSDSGTRVPAAGRRSSSSWGKGGKFPSDRDDLFCIISMVRKIGSDDDPLSAVGCTGLRLFSIAINP